MINFLVALFLVIGCYIFGIIWLQVAFDLLVFIMLGAIIKDVRKNRDNNIKLVNALEDMSILQHDIAKRINENRDAINDVTRYLLDKAQNKGEIDADCN